MIYVCNENNENYLCFLYSLQFKVPSDRAQLKTVANQKCAIFFCVSHAVALLPGSNATVLYGNWLIAEIRPLIAIVAHCH